MYKTILVPLDGSPFAEHALPLALALARRSHAGIHLVAVSTPVPAAYLATMSVCLPELEEELTARYQDYLVKIMARLRERIDASITGEVIIGDPASTLCDLAASGEYDLVVMATHGRSPLGRFFLGSVTDQVICHGNLPLLAVRPGAEEPNLDEEPDLGRVVVPLDGTAAAEKILEPALALAGLMPEAEVVLVRALPATGPEEESDVADSQMYREAQEYLAGVARRLAAHGLRVQTHLVFENRPAEAILNEVEDRHAGLIAMETHGRTGLARLLLGSIADKVVRSAHVPVLVRRPVKV